MTKWNRLKKEALEACKFRGHKMNTFGFTVSPHGDMKGGSYCKKCGKGVFITTRPLPNEIDFGGEAVALGCED